MKKVNRKLVVLAAAMVVLTGCSAGGGIQTGIKASTGDRLTAKYSGGWKLDTDDWKLSKEGAEVTIKFMTEENFDNAIETIKNQKEDFKNIKCGKDSEDNKYVELENGEVIDRVGWIDDSNTGYIYEAKADAKDGFDHVTFKCTKAANNKGIDKSDSFDELK